MRVHIYSSRFQSTQTKTQATESGAAASPGSGTGMGAARESDIIVKAIARIGRLKKRMWSVFWLVALLWAGVVHSD